MLRGRKSEQRICVDHHGVRQHAADEVERVLQARRLLPMDERMLEPAYVDSVQWAEAVSAEQVGRGSKAAHLRVRSRPGYPFALPAIFC